MFKKSQAAMEFLMTYGWAILVVLVAIGALAYFGVLSPDRFLPSKCQLPAGIACTDFLIEPTGIQVVLTNGLCFDLNSYLNNTIFLVSTFFPAFSQKISLLCLVFTIHSAFQTTDTFQDGVVARDDDANVGMFQHRCVFA